MKYVLTLIGIKYNIDNRLYRYIRILILKHNNYISKCLKSKLLDKIMNIQFLRSLNKTFNSLKTHYFENYTTAIKNDIINIS